MALNLKNQNTTIKSSKKFKRKPDGLEHHTSAGTHGIAGTPVASGDSGRAVVEIGG
jgi:hypothetical protein